MVSLTTSKKTALITGVSGQDGSYLADLLLEKGYRVVGLLRRSSEFHRENIRHLKGRMQFEYGDLVDQSSLDRVVAEHAPDEVYNLAAQSVPGDSWSHPITTGEVTALGVVRMLEAVRRCAPRARFYQGSSREIFGGIATDVMNEDTPLLANNPYGVAKVYGHLMMRTYRESYGMFACGGILFNHESPRRGLHFVSRKVTMAAACIKLSAESPLDEAGLPLVRDGKVHLGNLDAQRDWGYAKEYVDAMWRMLQRDAPRDYVIATNTLYSIRDLCRIAFDRVGLRWEDHVVSDTRYVRPTEITASRGDFSRAKQDLGWEPRTSFEDLVRLMVDADLERIGSTAEAATVQNVAKHTVSR
jgi:GDPmannose 4,6-dehydratase